MGNSGSDAGSGGDGGNSAAYDYGHTMGYHDAATGSTGDAVDYGVCCTADGNRGYADGYAQGSSNQDSGGGGAPSAGDLVSAVADTVVEALKSD